MKAKSFEYWTKDVAFYLDGVSFIYKRNPMSDALKAKNRVWRKRSEGLIFTTKGSKDLTGGKITFNGSNSIRERHYLH